MGGGGVVVRKEGRDMVEMVAGGGVAGCGVGWGGAGGERDGRGGMVGDGVFDWWVAGLF